MHLFLFTSNKLSPVGYNSSAPGSSGRHPLSLFLEIYQTQFCGYISPLASCQFNEIQTSLRDLSMWCIVSYLILLSATVSYSREGHTISGTAYVHLGGRDGIPSNPYIGFTPTPSFPVSCILGLVSIPMSAAEVV